MHLDTSIPGSPNSVAHIPAARATLSLSANVEPEHGTLYGYCTSTPRLPRGMYPSHFVIPQQGIQTSRGVSGYWQWEDSTQRQTHETLLR